MCSAACNDAAYHSVVVGVALGLTSAAGGLTSAAGGITILSLPQDILINIFSYLPLTDKCNVEQVCHLWRDISKSYTRLQNIIIDETVKPSYLQNILKREGIISLTAITMIYHKYLLPSYNILELITTNCKRLKYINISDANYIKNVECVFNCEELEYLSINNNNIKTIDFQNIYKLKNLKHLEFSAKYLITNIDINYIFNCCNLIFINIMSHATYVTDGGLININNCKNLECFVLSCDNNNITDQGLFYISQCKNLKIHRLWYYKNITDVGIKYLKKCENLEYIQIAYNNNITDISLIELFNSCKNLKHISLENCSNITDACLIAIFDCVNLEYLEIAYCIKIKYTNLKDISKCNNLKFIRIKNLPISNLVYLLRCKSLKYIQWDDFIMEGDMLDIYRNRYNI